MLGIVTSARFRALAESSTALNELVSAAYGNRKIAKKLRSRIPRNRRGLGHQFDGFGGNKASRMRARLSWESSAL